MPVSNNPISSVFNGISESQIRVFFWLLALGVAGIDAYTTRFFINSDAIAYIEIGEAMKRFCWHDVVNFTFSPLYSFLIAVFQSVVRISPLNEIIWIKLLNLMVFILTLGAFELLLRFLRYEYTAIINTHQNPIPWPCIVAMLYSILLVTTLVSIRVRLINPDMLVFCLILICYVVIMWIRKDCGPFYKYVILGILAGIGYLAKAYLFIFSPIFLAMAGILAGSFKKAVPRIAVASIFLAVTVSPLLVALSIKKGEFTYGEGGRHVYTIVIGGQGHPLNPGKVLDTRSKVSIYDYGNACTRPKSFDVCYWTIGIHPRYDNIAHAKMFIHNLVATVSQSRWLFAIIGWTIFQVCLGSYTIGTFHPASVPILFVAPAICGVTLFALISTEPRYVAPFLFVGSVGLIFGISYGENRRFLGKWGLSDFGVLVLVLFLVGSVINSSIDQAIMGLRSQNGKLSYQQNYKDQILVRNYLLKIGIKSGEHVAIVGRAPIEWARMAGLRITGEIEDSSIFFSINQGERFNCLTLLKNEGIRAVIAQGKQLTCFINEGWALIPGTQGYFVKLL